ncbi:MAG: hypothetical protein FJ147_23295 [Deltaproteobacteria bacterium]|nr:hypothetical protein [Deltaproteobacteria bacterium]
MVFRYFRLRMYALLSGIIVLCTACLAPGKAPRSAFAPGKNIEPHRELYGNLPLSFEANHGQTDPQVSFLSHGPGYALFLTATEAVLTLNANSPVSPASPTVVRMQVLGANLTPQVVGTEQLAGTVNYLRGNDPTLWRTNIPTYGKVHYHNVYSGIDLVYYGKQRQLEYDFIVTPGAVPAAIRLSFTDKIGQPLQQTLDNQGNLLLHTAVGDVQVHKPFIYQEDNGVRTEVAGSYTLQGSTVGFQVASYDTSKPLVIDPKLIVYSTFLGGDRGDSAFAMALDSARNVYLAGQTLSANFPLSTDVVDPTVDPTNGDAFVTKLNDTGTKILYPTYLGGAGADVAKAIAVDDIGNAYIAGETLATEPLTLDFPTTPNAVQPTPGGGISDAFVAKLDSTGSTLLYSTYLGGAAYDRANGIAIDGTGSAYVAGHTPSDLSVLSVPGSGTYKQFGSGPLAPSNPAALPHDAFVIKLTADGSQRRYTAVFSARAYEEATAIAVNNVGVAYVVGATSSRDFPTTSNALRTRGVDGDSNAFVTKLDATGTQLRYSTELGSVEGTILDPQGEIALAVAIDNADNAVVTGVTRAPGFPTSDAALVSQLDGVQDGFLTVLDVNAPIPEDDEELTPLYSTYLGLNNALRVSGLVVESLAAPGPARAVLQNLLVYLVGTIGPAESPSLPSRCAVQPVYGGGLSDAFLLKMEVNFKKPDEDGVVVPNDSGIGYSTYLGGSERDEAHGLAVDSDGNMYIAGFTRSASFPTAPGSFQTDLKGEEDAFVTKIDTLSNAPCTDLRLTMTDSPDPVPVGGTITYSLAVSNFGPDLATNVIVTNTLPDGVTVTKVTPSVGQCSGTSTIVCDLGTIPSTKTEQITIVGVAKSAGNLINRATVTASSPEVDENNNTVAASTTVVSGNLVTVTLHHEANTSGQVISKPEGISCPPDCSEAFPPGTPVILTATPGTTTSTFRGWGGACAEAKTSSFCKFTVSGALTVEANFALANGLAGEWVSATQTCQAKGKQKPPRCQVSGTLKVINTGTDRAAKFIIRFFFADSPTLNAGYVILKEKKMSGLNAKSEQLFNVDLRLPSGVSSSGRFIVAFIDANAQVAEGDEADNRVVFGPLP